MLLGFKWEFEITDSTVSSNVERERLLKQLLLMYGQYSKLGMQGTGLVVEE